MTAMPACAPRPSPCWIRSRQTPACVIPCGSWRNAIRTSLFRPNPSVTWRARRIWTKGNRKQIMKKHFQLATLFLAASLAAAAQNPDSRLYRRSGNEWVQEIKGTLPATMIFKVKSSAGSIRVEGMQQQNVTYTVREHVRAGSKEAARRELSRLKFTATSSAEAALLRAVCEGPNHGYIDFEIQLPAQTAVVKLETASGTVTTKNISGKVDATTGGGNIQLDQIGGVISVVSGGGDIDIGKAGSDVSVATGSGNIHIESAAGRVVASTGGGNLRIGAGKVMSLRTGAGWIQVSKCEGQVKAVTAGGSIELNEILGA